MPVHSPSCGGEGGEVIFTHRFYPAPTLEEFQKSRAVVIQPTYWRKFLVIAWSQMEGHPVKLRPKRPGPRWPDPLRDAQEAWQAARKAAGATDDPSIYAYRSTGQFSNYLNCHADAFLTAAKTLPSKDRTWLEAQDTVFSNCDRGKNIPANGDAYQIASAYFYAGEFAEAAERFKSLGRHYLAARCTIRRAGLADDKSAWEQADRVLAAIPTEDARRLRRYVAVRWRPNETLAELNAALVDPPRDADFESNLTDYEYLLDHARWDQDIPREATFEDVAIRAAGDMTDWVMTFQSRLPESFDHAVERFRQTGSDRWLLAALSKISGPGETTRELLQASEKIGEYHPAHESFAYYHARALRLSSSTQARGNLDRLLARPGLTPSLRNLYFHELQAMARSLDEFLRYAPRRMVGWSAPNEADSYEPEYALKPTEPPEYFFDRDSTGVFNRGLPLGLLAAAASSPHLPRPLAERVAASAFARAFLLNDLASAKRAAALLPGKPSAGSRFELALYILRNPGFRDAVVDGYDYRVPLSDRNSVGANWWCNYLDLDYPDKPLPPPFLTAEQGAQFDKEQSILSQRVPAPITLGRVVIDYVRANPSDPRAPEALHRTIYATRYGCWGEKTGDVSSEAFQLLHRKWPGSPWAKKTPYWYTGR